MTTTIFKPEAGLLVDLRKRLDTRYVRRNNQLQILTMVEADVSKLKAKVIRESHRSIGAINNALGHELKEKLSDNFMRGFSIFCRVPDIQEVGLTSPRLSIESGDCIYEVLIHLINGNLLMAKFAGNLSESPTTETVLNLYQDKDLFKPFDFEKEST